MRPKRDDECEDGEDMLNDEELVVPICYSGQPTESHHSSSGSEGETYQLRIFAKLENTIQLSAASAKVPFTISPLLLKKLDGLLYIVQ